MDQILSDIVQQRKADILQKGKTFGHEVPAKREVPVNQPDLKKGVLICEIKRGSPSEGKMNQISDPVEWAGSYYQGGADIISVLTEEKYFFGSLNDLMLVKKAFPGRMVLRKDFLLDEEEVEISYRAGADLVLLIVSILPVDLLERMMNKALQLGMTPLVEVHNDEEYQRVKNLDIPLLGINSRNLKTFKLDRSYPFGFIEQLKNKVPLIYESGIRNRGDAFFAGSAGFAGLLVGTSIVRSGSIQAKVEEIREGYRKGQSASNRFYRSVFHRIYFGKKPVFKICGITSFEDAELCRQADILGFILAESPRRVNADDVRCIIDRLGKNRPLVAVVVTNDHIDEAVKLVKEGRADVIQFHGDQQDSDCIRFDVNWYKALRIKTAADLNQRFSSPFVLLDAFSKDQYGGTGVRIADEVLCEFKKQDLPLFLAGGITPDNVFQILQDFNPCLIDVSSGLEESPGKKAPEKVKKIFDEIARFQKGASL